MAFAFNPITGKLDLVGSGGGGNPFDQSLNTTNSPSFASINTGQLNQSSTPAQVFIGENLGSGIQGLLVKNNEYDLSDFGLQTLEGKEFSFRLEGRQDYCSNGNTRELQLFDLTGGLVSRATFGDAAISIGSSGQAIYLGGQEYSPLNFNSTVQAADPTTTDLSAGRAGVYKNSTSGAVKLFYNDGGTMRSVALA